MRKIYQLKLILLTIFLSLYVFAFSAPAIGAQVTYCSHIANVGWLSWVSDGQTSGSPGSGNQMEAVQIKTVEFPSTYHIDYQAHVSYIGWQGWVSDGQTAGTVGEAKAIEAIQIKLRGFPSNYHVKYRAYVQNSGWQSWVSDGATAGTTDQGKAIEALAVEIYADPSIPPEAKITMTSQGQTVYENGTLNLIVTPGGTAHVDFSASRSSDPDGSVVSYQWYISGQPVSTSRDFAYDLGAGTHPIYLEVWDNQGAQGAVGATIIIGENQLPVAGLSMTSQGQTVYENGTLNLIVTPGGTAHVDFSASRSSDPDGSISSYQWRINGQPEYTTRDFDRDFPAGTHDILLEVWDNQGAQGAVGASIIIEEIPAPHITSISPTQIEASTFDLTINGSNFDNGAVDQIFWKADGHFVGQGTVLSQSSTRLVVREFMEGTEPGIYEVRVKNSDGQISSGVDLEIVNQPPEAKITMISGGQTVYENQTLNLTVSPGGTAHVDFSASRSSDPDGSVSSYQWRINGEPVSTSRDFAYVLEAGTHQILLDVWDNQGAKGAVGASIIISEDNIVYLDNGIVRVGVDLGQGGAIVEISHDGYNLIDTNDPGRLIQVSFWDDVNPNWNPIQAGDITGHLNPVTEHSSDSNSIYTKVRGINWLNTNPEPEWLDVDIEQWVTLEDQKVKVKYRVTHFGSDEHILHHQEFPSVYLRTELSDSITFSGNNPWNSDQVEFLGIIPGQSKFVMPTEHWVSFVNAEDFGLTIYSPYHTLLWKAERILGVSDPNYIAVVDQFGLTPGSVHETEVYFIVGNYLDSRQLIYNLELQNDAPKIDSIDPVTIEPSDFTLQILGSNFDQAIDQIYWKDDGHFVGQASEIISQSQTELIVPEKMAGAEPGAYLVTVRNSDGKLSNFVEMCVSHNLIPNFVPLFRGYSCDDSDHFYTTDIVERNNKLLTYGYTYEKIEAYISNAPFCNGVPLYRLYHETRKSHYYTTSNDEKEGKILEGFIYEGITGYVYQEPSEYMVPMYHLYNSIWDDHFYTISEFERDNATDNLGFVDEGIVGYVSPWDLKERNAHTRPQANYGGVDLGSGAYRGLNSLDLMLKGRGPSLAFSHYYNSFNSNHYPMGQGWSHSLYSRIFEDIEGDKVYVFWGNGTVSEFTKTGSSPSDYHDETGNHDALTLVDDAVNDKYGYDLRKKDQTVFEFREIGEEEDYLHDIVLFSIEDWTGNQLIFDYDAANATLLSVRDEFDRELRLNYYDLSRQLQKVEEVINDVVKRSVLFTYNDKELLVSFTDSREKVTTYLYYEEDGPRKNLLKSITYPEHNTVKLDYDDSKKANDIQLGNDPASSITYDPVADTTTVQDPRGNVFTYKHNNFRLTSQNGPDMNPASFEYADPQNPNKPTRIVDKESNPTNFEYDFMGNVTEITNARGKVALFTYNTDVGKNNIKSGTEFHTEGTAITPTMYNYDTDGNRLRSITNPENETMWLYYDDANHQVTSMKDGRSKYTYFDYDKYGNLERISDAENNVTHYVNDYAGRTIQVIDGETKNTWYFHDDTDNLTSVKNHLNHEVAMSYNGNDFLDAVTWLTNGVTASTNYDYDSEDRLKSVTNPLTSVTSFTYNESGNLETRNDYNGVTTTYQYDENNRLKTINYPGDVDDISIGRDKNGSILSATGPEGESKFEYNELNLLKKYTDPYGKIVQYEYNDAGRLKMLTYPGGKTVTYGYDNAGLLQNVQGWITGSNPTTYEYDDAGNLTKIVRPNNTEAIYTYDNASRFTGITEQKTGGAAICSYAYALDSVGNHYSVTVTEPLTGSVLPKDVAYTHDKANRLLSAGSITYTYDNNGNRATSTAAGGTSYTWNHENMLTGTVENSPSGSVQYQYDGMNNRIARIEESNTTKYVLDLSGNMSRVLAETDENGTIQAYYVYGLGLISRIIPDESRHFYHYNNRGDTIALTDASGNVKDSYAYDKYGKLLDSTGSTENPFKFVGRYGVMDEEDDLYFMRARFYDAEAGRFLSEDPLGFEGGDWNLYAYVGGNPLMGIDPEGTFSIGWNPLNAVVASVVELPSMVGNFTQQSYYTYKYFSSYYNGEDYARNAYSELAQESSNKVFKSVGTIAFSSLGAKTSGSKNATKVFGKTGALKVLDMRTRKGIFVKQVWTVAEEKLGKHFLKKILGF